MHYHAEIWIENTKNVEAEIEKIMAPHEEKYTEVPGELDEYGDPKTISSGFWDWYQIGGRWTGNHDGYDPDKDPRNIVPCNMCGGTGYRMDASAMQYRLENPTYTCNGCGTYKDGKWEKGDGNRPVWPTDYKPHYGDVMAVAECPEKLECATLIICDKIFHQEEWTGEEWKETDWDGNVKSKLAELGVTGGYLVTVDYHS